jgi:hypothetical protein
MDDLDRDKPAGNAPECGPQNLVPRHDLIESAPQTDNIEVSLQLQDDTRRQMRSIALQEPETSLLG